MRFLNKKESRKYIGEHKLDIDLDVYALLEDEDNFFMITRDIQKLDLNFLKIKRIGLKL
ncbi:MAG TPA: hypothetical protein VJB94_00935 [Candidatus Nanoarchaeia archaeon]|nr:hypothetical protein [Candidatus Nanoarchaeia archaeon]